MAITTTGRLLALALLGALLLGMLSPPSIGAGEGAVYIWRDADGAVRFSTR